MEGKFKIPRTTEEDWPYHDSFHYVQPALLMSAKYTDLTPRSWKGFYDLKVAMAGWGKCKCEARECSCDEPNQENALKMTGDDPFDTIKLISIRECITHFQKLSLNNKKRFTANLCVRAQKPYFVSVSPGDRGGPLFVRQWTRPELGRWVRKRLWYATISYVSEKILFSFHSTP